ncbi:hypothetical protein H4R99_001939 [Coemansia sp. RSA 1722]|nr:hypothetical protein IWW45_000912 [Coemansia sp. RSA 485]KAJ2604234.1 hypothetical protein H4R99_001939 [Coemansia sp. RSA 1722]KAJ2636538.1 hypothetical protein GGF40_002944 [Coemansia sp. RSA 1286]
MLASLVFGHISIIDPCPRYSPVGINCPELPAGETLDAENNPINGPINSIQLGGTMPLCRHETPYDTPSATWTAGQSVTIKFNPNAASHSGGHCEFSISYNGKDFAVIHQELRYCFRKGKPAAIDNTAEVLQYTFDLPEDLPSSDKAIFSWTWVNASGNREFYMNCADIAIEGGTSSSYTGKKMTIVNYPGYPTVEEFNMDYETGIDLYTDTEQITISPDGTTTSGKPNKVNTPKNDNAGSSISVKSSSTTSSEDETSPTPKAKAVVISNKVQKVQQVGDDGDGGSGKEGGSCGSSIMQCSGDGYQMCVNGAWSPEYPCGAGTVCQSSGGAIYCGWP